MNNSDIFCVYWYKLKDGSIEYRCRGIGSTYKKFYNEWIWKSSYRCIGEDFPWDFFVFDEPEDHDRLLKDFPNDIFEDKDNEIHIICDETNNTQEDVDNNRLNLSIYIK